MRARGGALLAIYAHSGPFGTGHACRCNASAARYTLPLVKAILRLALGAGLPRNLEVWPCCLLLEFVASLRPVRCTQALGVVPLIMTASGPNDPR